MKKPTIVLGANNNPERYAYKAVDFLQSIDQPVYPVGVRKGEVLGLTISDSLSDPSIPKDIHTITLYINPMVQEQWYQKILDKKPKRVIFNPGTENEVFEEMLEKAGIQTEEACTLVMVRTGVY
ncbi:MAG: CoA-binding protein [Flavobacteriales bacterium]|nr:CoA-binding protein [Flavobacteriales bacterium]